LQLFFAVSEIYPETHTALDRYRIGIPSNNLWGAPSQAWPDEWARYGIWNRGEKVIFCSDAGWRKSAIFRQAP
jgi:hypothetical protein